MSKTVTKPAEPKTGTTLSCHALKAAAVCVAGTFNDWNPTAKPVTR